MDQRKLLAWQPVKHVLGQITKAHLNIQIMPLCELIDIPRRNAVRKSRNPQERSAMQ